MTPEEQLIKRALSGLQRSHSAAFTRVKDAGDGPRGQRERRILKKLKAQIKKLRLELQRVQKANEPGKSTEAVLLRHMENVDRGDLDAVMADYASHAVLLTPAGAYRGHEQIRPVLQKLIHAIFTNCRKFKMIRQEISGEIAFIVWSAESGRSRIPSATDTFVIRNGKIVAQTMMMDRERR